MLLPLPVVLLADIEAARLRDKGVDMPCGDRRPGWPWEGERDRDWVSMGAEVMRGERKSEEVGCWA